MGRNYNPGLKSARRIESRTALLNSHLVERRPSPCSFKIAGSSIPAAGAARIIIRTGAPNPFQPQSLTYPAISTYHRGTFSGSSIHPFPNQNATIPQRTLAIRQRANSAFSTALNLVPIVPTTTAALDPATDVLAHNRSSIFVVVSSALPRLESKSAVRCRRQHAPTSSSRDNLENLREARSCLVWSHRTKGTLQGGSKVSIQRCFPSSCSNG